MSVQSSGRNLLDQTAGVPLYIQLLADFEARIASGQWAAESLIPSEQSLCAMYGVSRTTVRQALRELTAQGLLYRKAGRGSFVKGRRPSVRYQKYISYTDEMRARGHKPSSRFISREQVPADTTVAIGLGKRELGLCPRARIS